MPSADTESTETVDDAGNAAAADEARSALLEAISAELGPAVLDSHLIPGRDLWVRIEAGAWASTADYLRNRQRFRFFDWLSAIDWMPSPFGRSMDAAVDNIVEGKGMVGTSGDVVAAAAGTSGGVGAYAGGDTRFQVLARVYNLSTKLGVTLKADVGNSDDSLEIESWTPHYPGANWHEREAFEMFGITFVGHPGLRKLYLPGDFEGHPMRKDFPLLARLIKPWPGIVDVEPMPNAAGEADGEAGGASTTNPEAGA